MKRRTGSKRIVALAMLGLVLGVLVGVLTAPPTGLAARPAAGDAEGSTTKPPPPAAAHPQVLVQAFYDGAFARSN